MGLTSAQKHVTIKSMCSSVIKKLHTSFSLVRVVSVRLTCLLKTLVPPDLQPINVADKKSCEKQGPLG